MLFNDLNQEVRDNIIKQAGFFRGLENSIYVESFKEKDHIVRFDQPVTKLFFLLEGKAKVTMVHEDGKRSIVRFLNPKELIGELSLIEVDNQPKDIEAINLCTCLVVSIVKAREVLLQDCDFMLMLTRYIGKNLLSRTWFQMKFQNYNFRNRLAAYMLMSESNGEYKERHTETAEYLHVSYRHLLYTLKQFLDEGLISRSKKGYHLDIEALNALALDILDNTSGGKM